MSSGGQDLRVFRGVMVAKVRPNYLLEFHQAPLMHTELFHPQPPLRQPAGCDGPGVPRVTGFHSCGGAAGRPPMLRAPRATSVHSSSGASEEGHHLEGASHRARGVRAIEVLRRGEPKPERWMALLLANGGVMETGG